MILKLKYEKNFLLNHFNNSLDRTSSDKRLNDTTKYCLIIL